MTPLHDRHSVLFRGRYIRVSRSVQKLYERWGFRVLGYSVSSTIYGEKR